MYIAISSRLKIEKYVWRINIAFLIGAVSATLWFLSPELRKNEKLETSLCEKGVTPTFSFEAIGYGPLALNGVRIKGIIPNLDRELVVLGENSRPDRGPGEVALLLGLKSTAQEQVALSGMSIFLRREPQDIFSFSPDKTPLVITPTLRGDGTVLIEVALEDRRGEFILKSKQNIVNETLPFFKALKEGKWWGIDLFLKNYGGKEFSALSGKQKIEFPGSICFVQEGDFLIWEDEKWKQLSSERPSPFSPIARIAAISSKGVDIEAWDESGFYPMKIQIPPPHLPRVTYKLEELVTSIRPRTASGLSCILGKRRVILREGDWWLKSETGWSHLKTLNDIEDYLAHKIRGELFIFETIATERGKTEVKGHFFDTMRTQIQPISLTLKEEGKDRKNISIARKSSHGAANASLIAKSEEKQKRLQLPQYNSGELEEKKTP